MRILYEFNPVNLRQFGHVWALILRGTRNEYHGGGPWLDLFSLPAA